MLQNELLSVRMHLWSNILVNDPSPFDISISDISVDGLKQEVSTKLQIPYLSKYKGSMEELRGKLKYSGGIIGNHSRLFFSIPTARKHSQDYYYIHYLLDTSSAYTTLTHQALCCLFGENADNHNTHFPQGINCLIGGNVNPIETHLSNPILNDQSPTNYRNVNRLGQNFLRQYKICKLEQNFKSNEAVLELIE